MASEGFRVEPAALVTHAGAVQQAAGQSGQALSAVSTVRLDTAAYGQLMQWLPPLFSHPQDALLRVLGEVAQTLQDSAGGLRSVASSYEQTDIQVARSYSRVVEG